MPAILKRNAVIIFGLSCLFYWSFMFAKHAPALRGVIPFADDPYDAVGSFAVIVGMLLALLSLLRAFRPYSKAPSAERRIYLIRSQQAVVLAVFMTLASDLVAMGRHPSMWVGSPSRNELVALVGGMALLTAAVQLIIRASQEKVPQHAAGDWTAAAAATLLALLILVAYPEQLIHGVATHLLTVVAADLLLFAPMPLLLNALVPYKSEKHLPEKTPPPDRSSAPALRWGIVVLAGIFLGACVFLSETAEGSNTLPLHRLLFVASVFIGLGLAGFLLAYLFLRKPLGLESSVGASSPLYK